MVFDAETALGINKAIRRQQPPIASIPIEFPENAAPVNPPSIQDYRPVPTSNLDLPIDKGFVEYYINRRIVEWNALGGIEDQWRRYNLWTLANQLGEPRHSIDWLLNPFFFDIWKYQQNFRHEYARTRYSQWILRKFYLHWKARALERDLDLLYALEGLTLEEAPAHTAEEEQAGWI